MEFFVALIVCIIVTFCVYFFLKQPASSTSTVTITSGQDGKVANDFTNVISVSKNQGELTFSYAGWIQIDDFTYRFGERKTVFSKGADDLSSTCPALVLDANTNSFLVILDTYGTQEIIPISNIPAKKWIHVGIAVNQDAVDVYINGVLYMHHSLAQIPRQNTDTVHTGVGGGFDGKIALLEYHPSFLGPSDMMASMQTSPSPSHEDKSIGPLPPYFDISWWTKQS
jgi:hypothetical protein